MRDKRGTPVPTLQTSYLQPTRASAGSKLEVQFTRDRGRCGASQRQACGRVLGGCVFLRMRYPCTGTGHDRQRLMWRHTETGRNVEVAFRPSSPCPALQLYRSTSPIRYPCTTGLPCTKGTSVRGQQKAANETHGSRETEADSPAHPLKTLGILR